MTLALVSAATACGPDFPNSYYAMPEQELLAAPEGFFAAEIARLGSANPAFRAVRAPKKNPHAATIGADLAELHRALTERGWETTRAQRVEWNYEAARRALERKEPEPFVEKFGEPAREFARLAEVPAEFADYLRGASAWQRGDLAEARAAWTRVLALPPKERRYRSTWAAFMLGRVLLRELEEKAAPAAMGEDAARAFQKVRAFASEGLPDPLGLAAASLGWEARVALDASQYETAVRLYLEQYATGDESALESLRRTAEKMASLPEVQLTAVAKNQACRRVLTAYYVARGGVHYDSSSPVAAQIQTWGDVLDHAGVREVAEADRLAWLAYEGGRFELAQKWSALAPDGSAEAQWIKAKLALRSGDLATGERLLRVALTVPTLGQAHRARVAAELSRVCLAQDDFRGALAASLTGEHWEDAAYIAERVMTVDELAAFVDSQPPPANGYHSESSRPWWQPQDVMPALRQLLARRLARAGQFARSEKYFPEKIRAVFLSYVSDVQIGFDAERSIEERAAAFWRAAQCARVNGLELLGTELDPDWAIWDGNFGFPASSAELRMQLHGGPFAPTAAEIERLKGQSPPQKRFHYRYRATELAWWAASLMPNDSEETARVLLTAGGWLKARDPKAAEPFYQALVIRCAHTALGREAAQRHWFPSEKMNTEAPRI